MDKVALILFAIIFAVWTYTAIVLIPVYGDHNAFDELDIYTNGTHYIFNKYIDDHLYGHSMVNYDGAVQYTGTLRIDDTNANKWHPLPDLQVGKYHWDWYLDTARTQDIDSITFTVVEPIPEPIPEVEKFWICHNGNEIMVGASAVDTHVINHGDTPGMCPVVVPPIYNGTTSLPDPDYSAIVVIPDAPQYMDICHNNEIIQVNGNSVRYHLQHGDAQFECPLIATPSTEDKLDVEDLTKDELISLVTKILTELMSR